MREMLEERKKERKKGYDFQFYLNYPRDGGASFKKMDPRHSHSNGRGP